MMKMRRPKFAFSEKRFLWLSTLMCAVPLALSGLYEWNNRVPDVQLLPRIVPKPNAEEWFLKAVALYVPPKPNRKILGGGVDLPFEDMPAKIVPVPYSAEYNRIYLPARKIAFLRANAAALATLRLGLQFSYAYSAAGYSESDIYWSRLRELTRLLIVEAHARAQRKDWNGAANSLLDAYHLGCVLPQEADLFATYSGSYRIRTMVRHDFWELLPHLSASQCRNTARKVEKTCALIPSLAQSFGWEKRYRQELLIRLIEQRDFRPLYTDIPYACVDLNNAACSMPKAEIQSHCREVAPFIRVRSWMMNKPQLMTHLTNHMDWEIAQVKKPYPKRDSKWPDPKNDDHLDSLLRRNDWWITQNYARSEAQDVLLSTSLAIRAFRLEKQRNPQTLDEIVPRYLARVPLDPCFDGQPLRYQNKLKRFLNRETYETIYVVNPSQLNTPGSYRTVRQYESVSFTLYSIGHNARDDGGAPYEDKNQREAPPRYIVDYNQATSIPADIIAGINN